MNAYNLNTLVRLSAAFTDSSTGLAKDPTSVTCTTVDPAGTTATVATAKDSVGNYHADVTPTVWGTWGYTFAGTGAVVAQGQGQFFVEPGV